MSTYVTVPTWSTEVALWPAQPTAPSAHNRRRSCRYFFVTTLHTQRYVFSIFSIIIISSTHQHTDAGRKDKPRDLNVARHKFPSVHQARHKSGLLVFTFEENQKFNYAQV